MVARALGASYERTLMIGRQNLFADPAEIGRAYAEAGGRIGLSDAEAIVRGGAGYAEPLLQHLGARQVDSLDASSYEQATLVHDLNRPLPDELRGRYSMVFDGGSLEHVFNFPQALKNCMEAVEPGGHLITITPANNQFGHGFYQFSPDLFYQALAPANGFRVVAMLIRDTHRFARWREVSNPETVGTRVTLTSPWQSLLFVLAGRVSDVEPFTVAPQQSDYTVAWSDTGRPVSRRLAAIERLPGPIGRVGRLAAAFAGTTSDRHHFRRVNLSDLVR